MQPIKSRIALGADEDGEAFYATVREASLPGGKLGLLDLESREIVIHSEQPEAGKHLILLHEMIHAVAANMKAQGLCRRQPSEAFVANLAGGLFGMLAMSGMWVGVSPEDARKFFGIDA